MIHKIISIDGNIGAGKSTFLNYLRNHSLKFSTFYFIDEPVDVWTSFKNEKGETLLEVYYKDKERWSYTFQNCVFLTRMYNIIKILEEHKNDTQPKIFITERFVDTDFNIFARMLHDEGFINNMEWKIYKEWYQYLTTEYRLSGIIYISCPPEKCYERINIRKRAGEDKISLDYLIKLDEYHKKWLDSIAIPILNIDTSEDCKFVESLKKDIDKFLNIL